MSNPHNTTRRGSGIELATTPVTETPDMFVQRRASQKPKQQRTLLPPPLNALLRHDMIQRQIVGMRTDILHALEAECRAYRDGLVRHLR